MCVCVCEDIVLYNSACVVKQLEKIVCTIIFMEEVEPEMSNLFNCRSRSIRNELRK